MQSSAITAVCRNVEIKRTENAIVCENSGERMLRTNQVRENASLGEWCGLNAKGVMKQRYANGCENSDV